MRYREHAPRPVLAPYVACTWTLVGHLAPNDAEERTVVPDACMDVLFNLAPSAPGSAASRVIGTMTRPLPVRNVGMIDFLGVRFHPGGATPFLRPPAHEITDGTLGLEDVWGAGTLELTDRLREATSTEARVHILEDALERRLARESDTADRVVLEAAGMAQRARGAVGVDALADATGLGRRQLERRFLAVVGIPPKTACRVIRFQHALSRLIARPGHTLSRVALEAGYHDQAHFTREFHGFAGVTPGAYRRARPVADTADDAFVQDRETPGP